MSIPKMGSYQRDQISSLDYNEHSNKRNDVHEINANAISQVDKKSILTDERLNYQK